MRQSLFSIAFLLLLAPVSLASVVHPQGLDLQAATGQYATTITTTLTTTSAFLSGHLEIPGFKAGTDPPCGWTYSSFTVSQGQHVSALLTSPKPISLLVMSDSVWKSWTVSGYSVARGEVSPCHGAPDGVLIVQEGITSYSYSFNFPTDGVYWFVFYNLFSSTPVVANFDLVGSPAVITSTTVVGSQSISSSVVTTVSSQTLSGQVVPFSLGQIGLLIPAVLGSAVILASFVFLMRRRKTVTKPIVVQSRTVAESPGSKARLSEASEPTISTGDGELDGSIGSGAVVEPPVAAQMKYCSECGAENPVDAQFCGDCGTPVNRR